MKKKVLVIILILTVIIFPGCWSRREIEDLAIVTAFGIDKILIKGKREYKLSFLIARPSQLGGQQSQPSLEVNPDWLVTEVGTSPYEAVRKLYRRSPRPLKLYHNDIIIIGETVARDGIEDIVDYLQRHRDIRMRTWVLVSRGDAYDVMNSLPELERLLSQEISEVIVKSNPGSSESYPVNLKLFTESLVTPGWDAVIPVVKSSKAQEAKGSKREEKEPTKTVVVEGLGVFKKNKMAGFLSAEETKGFLYVIGKARGGTILFKTEFGGGSEISVLMSRASSEIKPVFREGQLEMEVQIKAEGDIGEVQGNAAVGEPEVIRILERRFSAKIKELAENVIEKSQQEYQADIFAFGRKLHARYPDYWREVKKDWHEIYPDLPVTVKVEGRLRRTSVIADPYQIH